MSRWEIGASGASRGTGAFCALSVVAVLALTGCTIAPATATELAKKAPSTTFAESILATQAMLGGDWQVRDDPSARACALPGGGTGESTPALRIRVLDLSDSLDSVASAWTQWGYTVTESTIEISIGEVAEVQARGAAGEYLILRASENAVVLQGESACAVAP